MYLNLVGQSKEVFSACSSFSENFPQGLPNQLQTDLLHPASEKHTVPNQWRDPKMTTCDVAGWMSI